jgi:aminopeptidase N
VTALTYAEAQERSRRIDVREYAIDLDVTRGDEVFGSVTVVRFGCRTPGAGSFIELRPAVLRRAVLNGQDLDTATLDGNRLPLTGLRADNELRVEADMAYSRTGEGMHHFSDPVDGETYLAAACGVDNAQRIFAVFDQPDLKAVIKAAVVAPPDWTVAGNGIARPAGPGPGRWELSATPPISSYLFTVVAGPYYGIRAVHRGIPFGLHCRRSLTRYLDRDAGEILSITRACFDRYLEIFAEPYPFDSYDQAFVPELAAGAMENPGCVTFREEFLFRSAVTRAERQTRGIVIAHEMAHMWFGDLVTMRWWDDVWLSESFAEYMGFQVLSEATAFTGTWTDFALARKPRGYDADQRTSTHPVAPGPRDVHDTDAALSNYDDISYAKGASALRQLVAWIGWPAFLAGINDYLGRHRFGNAALADLLDCLTRASGRDVRRWAGHWLRSSGVDTLMVSWEGGGDGTASVRHLGSRPHRVSVGIYDRGPADQGQLTLRARFAVSVAAGAGSVALPPAAVHPRPALVLPNDGDLSYCKIRFDPHSWATVTSCLSGIGDPLSRAAVWNAARDLVRDGELSAQEYLGLAARHLPAETDTSIVGHVLGFARGPLADSYLPPGLRGAALRRIAGICQDLLGRPPAAGRADGADGLRLAAVRGLIDSASGPDDIAALRSWLAAGRLRGDGGHPGGAGQQPGGLGQHPGGAGQHPGGAGQLPAGAAFEPSVRWQILLRLTVLGAAGRPEIEQEAERDASAAGRQSAARCRAAIGDRAAKQAAWTAMFDPVGTSENEPSSDLLAATAQGFWQAEQAELLAGYVQSYFPALARAAARRDAAIARVLVRHGFPQHAVDAATLRAGEQCLRSDGLSPALRRLLADQLDDLRRALHVSAGQPHAP